MEINLGNNEVNIMTQLNPDISYGLFCGTTIYAKARAINRANSEKKTTDELKKVVS